MEQKLWILKSKGEKSAFGGNLGYADQPSSHYLYDTNVKNHNKLKVDDLVIIADKRFIIGFAKITSIDIKQDIPKVRYRCPICKTQEHYTRVGVSPKYKCRNKHEFETPYPEDIFVDEYTANYITTFIRPKEQTSVKILDQYYLKRNFYYSIQEVNIEFFKTEVPEITGKLQISLAPFKYTQFKVSNIPPYIPSHNDERDYDAVTKAMRKGQSKFKGDLINIYNHFCMVTGCTVPAAIEASHICPYKGKNDNNPFNGLLLRTDLHKLFDANLLGIDPVTLKIEIHPSLETTYYKKYKGKKLKTNRKDFFPSHEALEYRWTIFKKFAVS